MYAGPLFDPTYEVQSVRFVEWLVVCAYFVPSFLCYILRSIMFMLHSLESVYSMVCAADSLCDIAHDVQ